MLKVTGGIMVLLGCAGMGIYAAMRYLIRIRILEEIEQAIQFMYGEIEYAGSDMIEIMHQLATRGHACKTFWKAMEQRLVSNDGSLFYCHWQETISMIEGFTCLASEECMLLDGVGKNLGNMNRETQLHTLALFLERLHEILIHAKGEYREKKKVSSIVGITAGFFLAVLLW